MGFLKIFSFLLQKIRVLHALCGFGMEILTRRSLTFLVHKCVSHNHLFDIAGTMPDYSVTSSSGLTLIWNADARLRQSTNGKNADESHMII
jgi:hypothetical protein